jgi:hypothetical protein
MSDSEPQRMNAIEGFLLEDYKLKTDFLKAQFERLWKRFEFFLVIESALLAFFFKFLLTEDGAELRQNAWLVAVLGLISSSLGLLFGAQDRYLVNSYREAVRRAAEQLTRYYSGNFNVETWRTSFLAVSDPEVRVEEPTGRMIDVRGPLEWRTSFASTTMLPAWFAIAVSVIWLLTLLLFA